MAKEYTYTKDGLPISKSFEKLYKMQCWNEVFLLLKESRPIPDIVSFVFDEKHEPLTISRQSLQSYLYKFVAACHESFKRDQAIMSHVPLIKSISENVDPSQVYQLLIGIQFERIMIAFGEEVKKQKLGGGTNEAVRCLLEVLNSMSKDAPKRLDAGTVDAAASNVVDNLEKARKVYEERFGSVASTILTSHDGRRRMLNLLEMVKSATSGEFAEILSKRKEGDSSQ